MTAENFCYWLQGWFELNTTIDHRSGATKETLDMMKSHLDLVFNKVTDKTPETKFSTLTGIINYGGLGWEPDYYKLFQVASETFTPPTPKKEETLYC